MNDSKKYWILGGLPKISTIVLDPGTLGQKMDGFSHAPLGPKQCPRKFFANLPYLLVK